MFLKYPQKAFSLVELLIGIGIVGLLTAVSISSLSTIQKNNRDAKRLADLKIIQGALQRFYADQNYFPDSIPLTTATSLNNCTGMPLCTQITKTYLTNMPTDPTPASSYCYRSQISATNNTVCGGTSSGKCHYYELCAKLENPNGTAASCSCNNQNNFKVSPL